MNLTAHDECEFKNSLKRKKGFSFLKMSIKEKEKYHEWSKIWEFTSEAFQKDQQKINILNDIFIDYSEGHLSETEFHEEKVCILWGFKESQIYRYGFSIINENSGCYKNENTKKVENISS